jgi:universal stress protein E
LLPKSESAIERARLLAEELNAELSLLHVVTPRESDRMLEQDLQRASLQLKSRARPPLWREGPAPNVFVRAGGPAGILIETAKDMHADVIVLGTHRKRSARDALAGTIVERVLSEHQCPVLIVKRMPEDAYRNILLALDRSASSASALRAAEALLVKDPVQATIVHAFEPPYEQMMNHVGIATEAIAMYTASWKREATNALRDILKQASSDFSRYELILQEARPAAAIQKVAKRVNPDLLVLGTRGHGRIRRALLGSTANRILATARTDVLVVPDGSQETTARRRRFDRHSLEVVAGA